MKRAIVPTLALLVVLGGAAACTITDPSPETRGSLLHGRFDRAWNNALGAARDEGFAIAVADLAGGRFEARRGDVTLVGQVTQPIGGSPRATFTAHSDNPEGAKLAQRVQQRYDERMARPGGDTQDQ